MSTTNLIAQISALATRAATEDKAIRLIANTATTNIGTLTTGLGTLANLTTTHKGDVVTAINDVVTLVGTAQTAATNAGTAAANANTAIAALVIPAINDTAASTTSVYSSSKVESFATAAAASAVNAIAAGAPAALDTLKELADSLNDDAHYAATVTTSLATKLTASNNLSDVASPATALTNLGGATAASVATVTTGLATLNTEIGTINQGSDDNFFVSIFTAALA